MAELPKSLREAASAAVLNAMLRADVERKPLFADELADAAIAAVLGACEVREEWGVRLARVPNHVAWNVTEATARSAGPEGYGAGLRRLVITTAAEDVTGEVGRG